MKESVLFSWSGGKDSAYALYELTGKRDCEIVLLTTLSEKFKRISMHGVREELLDIQADSLGLPLEKVWIPANCTNEQYESIMDAVTKKYLEKGFRTTVFGDLFLEDLRIYREVKLEKSGMKAEFPIWKRDSRKLSREIIESGFKAITTCVDLQFLGREFSGMNYDEAFLNSLPTDADPCGENGEFHTFVYDGPIFRKPVAFRKGKVVLKNERYYYCDLLKA